MEMCRNGNVMMHLRQSPEWAVMGAPIELERLTD
jgi:hypothetical protein